MSISTDSNALSAAFRKRRHFYVIFFSIAFAGANTATADAATIATATATATATAVAISVYYKWGPYADLSQCHIDLNGLLVRLSLHFASINIDYSHPATQMNVRDSLSMCKR